ncbi:MAG: flagellar hook-basal body complex protein [Hydrogenoanaerobacterium sp.]
MVRSMYSGVSGMKAHQARMDVIGNNIANVNTYGFKGSRATFRDVYYQTLKNASGATGGAGGGDPSQVGYGAQLASVDVLMGGSSFTMTDNSMDLGIDGEGFFQVQDQDGNIFYTRAGQLKFDSAGNLVDAQRNFVLGVSGNPMGKPSSSEKIQIQVPSVPPTAAKSEDTLNDVKFKINATNTIKDGNVGFTIEAGQKMTDGIKATAEVGANGITIKLNPKEIFKSEADLTQAINDAITKTTMATNGKPHPAGNFTFSLEPKEAFKTNNPNKGLTGEEICSSDYAVKSGKITGWPKATPTVWGGFKANGVTGDKYTAGSTANPPVEGNFTKFDCAFTPATAATPPVPGFWTVTATIGGKAYSGKIDSSRGDSGTMKLSQVDGAGNIINADDYIEFERPSYKALNDVATDGTDGADPAGAVASLNAVKALPKELTDAFAASTVKASPATLSNALGLGSKKFVLTGGTVGGPQDVSNLTGISIGPDGVITAQHAVHGNIVVGRIDIGVFANPQGLLQVGGSYFSPTANSGHITKAQPGSDGAGALATGSLELSNVDLSREFSDMITTQRGFQANSRMITVSDTMLEELVNLKR